MISCKIKTNQSTRISKIAAENAEFIIKHRPSQMIPLAALVSLSLALVELPIDFHGIKFLLKLVLILSPVGADLLESPLLHVEKQNSGSRYSPVPNTPGPGALPKDG